MKATLLETDNEEVVDLIGSTNDLNDSEPNMVEFDDLTIACKPGSFKCHDGNRVEMTSIWGYKYLFQIH